MSTIKIDKELYHSRPSDDKRLEKEIVTYDLLDKLKIPYVRIDHEAACTIDDCNEIDSMLEIKICKNLFLRNSSKTDFYLLLMPGDKKFITKNLSKQIGCSRLSFAEGEYMEQFLNITPGSVSILGLMNDIDFKVRLLMDKEIYDSDYIGCHPCINTSSLKIKTSDIIEKFLPYTEHEVTVVEL